MLQEGDPGQGWRGHRAEPSSQGGQVHCPHPTPAPETSRHAQDGHIPKGSARGRYWDPCSLSVGHWDCVYGGVASGWVLLCGHQQQQPPCTALVRGSALSRGAGSCLLLTAPPMRCREWSPWKITSQWFSVRGHLHPQGTLGRAQRRSPVTPGAGAEARGAAPRPVMPRCPHHTERVSPPCPQRRGGEAPTQS